jgi:D-alanyl-D-alanine carboxypeptidase (penicillin-binding protein 5/6)
LSNDNFCPAKIALILSTFLVALVAGFGGLAAAQETTAEQNAQPEPQDESQGPEIEAEAWALIDAETGTYLFGKDPDKRLPAASTTKVMSALVALEEGVDLQREVAISREAEEFVGLTYSNVGLIAGERVSMRDLLVATLVPSGTEAVYALAEAVGGTSDRFVEMMNEQAATMGLENSNFETPAGLDTPNGYSSARDLATISRAAMEYPRFAEIVAMPQATINTNNREIEVFNTNNLLYLYPEATGIKTGTSPEAGPSLIAAAEDGGESYIAVILGAREDQYRFEAAQTLLGYAFANYDQAPLVRQDEIFEELQVPFRRDETVELVAAEEVLGPSGPGIEVETRVETRELPPQAEAGQELGEVEAVIDGRSIGSSPLVAASGYEEASFWTKTWYRIRNLFG